MIPLSNSPPFYDAAALMAWQTDAPVQQPRLQLMAGWFHAVNPCIQRHPKPDEGCTPMTTPIHCADKKRGNY